MFTQFLFMSYTLCAPPNSSLPLGIFYRESTKFDGFHRVVSYRFFFRPVPSARSYVGGYLVGFEGEKNKLEAPIAIS